MKIKDYLLMAAVLLLWSVIANAGQRRYEIRADGLACPYCAYGIEKKFNQIEGVTHVNVDLKKGLVVVTGKDSLKLLVPQLKVLFNDSGFTFRKIVRVVTTK